MKHILLLTDFSKNAKNAIYYALEQFNNQKCKFYILHIPTKSVYTTSDLIAGGDKSIYDSLVKQAKLKLDRFINKLKVESKYKNATFESIVDYETLTYSINQIVEKKEIDLIVMGASGATGAKEVIFGSNTINVIRKVDCTTLVIPIDALYKQPKNIFLPLEMSDSLESEAFSKLNNFLEQPELSLHILRLNERNKKSNIEKEDKDSLKATIKSGLYRYHLVRNVPLHYAVDTYLQMHDIDLMTLFVKKKTAFERFFNTSSTKKLSQDLKVPLLIFHKN
ncbi:universal stress protein [Xanthomarina sp. F1114]|uniref:universal stress protein n=1 Tax=Xanthomarina sp. F1114 TaxID=2996019 RepID=UPI00225E268B|nr:universal stress protein [Xanthomarina sp. F1114]MCX7546708.1 universal stress protein [Xanthomarina sp. F1114]